MKKNPFYNLVWKILRPLVLWLFPVEIQGRENLPDEPVVLCANHSSAWDPVLLVCALYDDVPMRIMAKQQLFRIPLVGGFIRFMGAFPVDRGNSDISAIKTAIKALHDGISLLIFPEGTRNRTDAPLLEFHAGSLKIAEKAQCPIVPMTIANAEQIFEAHSPCIRKTKVIIEYGEPIETKNLDRTQQKALTSQVVARISETYEKNMKLLSGENK